MNVNPYIERNIALVKERMLQQLDSSLDKGAHYIDQELNSSKYVLIRPLVLGFYNIFARPDINSGSKGNLQVCIEAGREAVSNPSSNLEQIVDKYFSKYLKNDQTAKYCNKLHKNYHWFVENTKNTFRAQLKNLIPMLMVADESVVNYDDLSRKSYHTAEKAKEVLYEQINFMEIGIQKIAADTSILNIPAGKDLILRVLQRGIKDTKEELLKSVDEAFQV